MPTIYMGFWSFVIIAAIGVWRLRTWGQLLVVGLVTALVLLLSQSLYVQLAYTAWANPDLGFSDPAVLVRSGLFGWMALLVMPCGWLGPVMGLHLVQRWYQPMSEG